MKKIKLNKGLFALVDDGDYDFLNKWKWRANIEKRTSYAVRTEYLGKINGKYVNKEIAMHRLIMKATDSKIQVDHKDHDGLNNQKSNLRLVSKAQNRINRQKTNSVTTSKYKGVSLIDNKRINKWRSIININDNTIHIGCFPSQEKAAFAYNEAARKYHGEFASLNEINL